MFKRVCLSLSVISLCFFLTPMLVSAQAGAASGTGKFVMDDGFLKSLDFDAKSDDRGTATGFMKFTDEAKLFFQDVDGTGEVPKEEPVPFSMSADLDTMQIEKNRAVISGIVRDSSYRSYIGKFVQLVIEDNDGVEVPDKLVWTFCEQQPGGWIPQDAEDPNDRGAFMSWWATDAERKDDVGIPSPNLIPGSLKSCQVYPLQTYEFASMLKWDGAIQITQ